MIKKTIFHRFSSKFVQETIFTHKPVLLNKVIEIFKSENNEIVLDLTFGFGGHSKALLSNDHNIKHIGIDRDQIAYKHALKLHESYPQFIAVNDRFSNLEKICESYKISKNSIDFILMDLGASSMQMDDGVRGFSLNKNAKLDMRMNQNSDEISAFDVVNYLNAFELANIFKKYGEERQSRKIANTIVEYRSTVGNILTTNQLAELVSNCVGWGRAYDSLKRKTHPATQIFQALRIFVNDELNELWSALTIIKKYLRPNTGRCVVISFHSLEDRLVKNAFLERDCDGVNNTLVDIETDKTKAGSGPYIWRQIGDPIMPTDEEIKSNPRARSAKLRIGKIVHQ